MTLGPGTYIPPIIYFIPLLDVDHFISENVQRAPTSEATIAKFVHAENVKELNIVERK